MDHDQLSDEHGNIQPISNNDISNNTINQNYILTPKLPQIQMSETKNNDDIPSVIPKAIGDTNSYEKIEENIKPSPEKQNDDLTLIHFHIPVIEVNSDDEMQTIEPTSSRFEVKKEHTLTEDNSNDVVNQFKILSTGSKESPQKMKKSATHHKKTIEKSNIYQCQYRNCTFESKSMQRFRNHIEIHGFTHGRGKKFICKCSYVAVIRDRYIRHCIKADKLYLNCKTCIYTCKYAKMYHSVNCTKHYSCTDCSFTTESKGSYYSHKKKHIDPSDYVYIYCNNCSYRTQDKSYLVRHMIINHMDRSKMKTFSCEYCSYKTIHARDLEKHKVTHVDQTALKKFVCEHCSYKTRHINSLRSHITSKHADPTQLTHYKCDSCTYETINKQCIKNHQKNHIDKREHRLYECEQCSFKTRHLNSITAHKKRHLNKYQMATHLVKCPFCQYSTIDKGNLSRHLKKHKTDNVVYKCNVCSFQTIYQQNLKRHMLSHAAKHAGLFEFKCGLCQFTTNNKASFDYHRICHKQKQKTFSCGHCEFHTLHKSKLYRHYRECHEKATKDVFLFKCKKCQFKTYHESSLNRHVEKLHGKKFYRCNICSYKTNHSWSLRKHQLHHSSVEKNGNYKCKFCRFKTTTKGMYMLHVDGHKKQRMSVYSCKSCPYQTLHGAALQKHYANQHSSRSCQNRELLIEIIPLEHMAYLSLAAFSYEIKGSVIKKEKVVDLAENKELVVRIVPLEYFLYSALH